MIINYENVQVELPYKVLHIENLNLIAEVNAHHTLNLEFLIEEENVEKYLEESVQGKEVKLFIDEKIIYLGKIIEIEISYKGQVAHFKINTISYSYDLDIKKHNQAFFNLQSTYEAVIRDVLKKYDKTDLKDNITYGKCIKTLLVQYKETDFEFLKRLATHFETVLVVDATTNVSKFHFGVEAIYKEVKLGTTFREIKTRFDNFNTIKYASKENLNQQNFIVWKIKSNQYIPLCSEVYYEGQRVCVAKVDMKIRKGEISYDYELKFLKGIKTLYKINPKLKGISLQGIVKNSRNNEMQLHFCINDSYNEAEGNKWFAYGREVSSFYCMPVLESKVHITFLTGDEKYTIVSNAVRIADSNAKYYSKISENSNKSYSTVDGQELLMTPEMIQIAEDDGKSIQITLQKDGNVSVTAKNISLYSSKKIEIGTKAPFDPKKNPVKPTSINISAKNKVTITRCAGKGVNAGHSIQLAEENHLRGIVKML